MNKKGLILDDGKVRNCTHNHRLMSMYNVAFTFCGYKLLIKQFVGAYVETFKDAIPFFLNIGMLIPTIIMFPIIPFIRAYLLKHRS